MAQEIEIFRVATSARDQGIVAVFFRKRPEYFDGVISAYQALWFVGFGNRRCAAALSTVNPWRQTCALGTEGRNAESPRPAPVFHGRFAHL
jgi:hypothetical protein